VWSAGPELQLGPLESLTFMPNYCIGKFVPGDHERTVDGFFVVPAIDPNNQTLMKTRKELIKYNVALKTEYFKRK
jgi:hypothetical protein